MRVALEKRPCWHCHVPILFPPEPACSRWGCDGVAPMSAFNALPAYCSQTASVASRTRILNLTGSDADYPGSAGGKLGIAPLASEIPRNGLSAKGPPCQLQSLPSGKWAQTH